MNKTDVIKAMEVIEGENIKRKKTPPTGDADKKKQLIRYADTVRTSEFTIKKVQNSLSHFP